MDDQTPDSAAVSAREVLPNNLRPVHYDLCFEPHLKEAVEFEGTVSIELEVIENTSLVTLNALDLEILKTQVITSDGETIELLGLEFDKPMERMSLRLAKELLAGSKAFLKQSFKGSMLHPSFGFHRCPVNDLYDEPRWMGATQVNR